MHHPSTSASDRTRCRAHCQSPAAEPTWLLPGEHIHAEITADAWRYLALDVPYDRRTILLGGPVGFLCSGIASIVGNHRARRTAEAVAALQWRYLGHLPLVVTSQRVLVNHGCAWWPIGRDSIETCEWREDEVVLSFRDDAPYAFCGPEASVIPAALLGPGRGGLPARHRVRVAPK